jgi:hypothetical protein
MARRSVHIPKTALSARKRESLRRSDFAVPSERKYPINDLFHARLALTYVLTPSNAAYRDEVVGAVLARYPELKFWWASRSKRLAAPARRKVANPSHTSENTMPVSKRNNPVTAYNVYFGTKHIDTVFQSGTSSADEVRRALIDHDGYDHRIRVTKARRKNPRHEVETEAYFAAMEPTRAKYTGRSPEEMLVTRIAAMKAIKGLAGKSDREVAKALGLDDRDPAILAALADLRSGPYNTNPAKRTTKRKPAGKRTGGRTAAQSNAAKAMRLFHSGKASSLAEAWAMLRR